jgi:hypothetical protein
VKKKFLPNIFLFIILVSLVGTTQQGLAWPGHPTSPDATHNRIITKAVEILLKFRPDLEKEFPIPTNGGLEDNLYIKEMFQGSSDADGDPSDWFGNTIYQKALSHALDPNNHNGAPPIPFTPALFADPAFVPAEETFAQAIDLYLAGDKLGAYRWLGNTLHILGDLSNPMHASPYNLDIWQILDWNEDHGAYESYVGNNFGNYIDNLETLPIFHFDSLEGHYNDQTVFGWLDNMAHISNPLLDDVYYCSATNVKPDCDDTTKFLLEKAVQFTAGFLAFFYSHLTDPSTIYDTGFESDFYPSTDWTIADESKWSYLNHPIYEDGDKFMEGGPNTNPFDNYLIGNYDDTSAGIIYDTMQFSQSFQDAEIDAYFYAKSSDNNPALWLRTGLQSLGDENCAMGSSRICSGYMVELNDDTFSLSKWTESGKTLLDSHKYYFPTDDVFWHVKMRSEGSHIQVWVKEYYWLESWDLSGEPLLEVYDSTFFYGKPALSINSDAGIDEFQIFDEVIIREIPEIVPKGDYYFQDHFTNSEIESIWSQTNNAENNDVIFEETDSFQLYGQKTGALEYYETDGKFEDVYLTKEIGRNIKEIQVDFDFNFPYMGKIAIEGKNEYGDRTFFAKVVDEWSDPAKGGAIGSYLYYPVGTLRTTDYTDSYDINPSKALPDDPGTGFFKMEFDKDNTSITINVSKSDFSWTRQQSLNSLGTYRTTQLSLIFSAHSFWYRSDTYGNFSHYVEKQYDDTENPTISIGSPYEGSSKSGLFYINADVDDNVGTYYVEFYIDGNYYDTSTINEVFTTFVESDTLSNGEHDFKAVAYDYYGNTAEDTNTAIIDNPFIENFDDGVIDTSVWNYDPNQNTFFEENLGVLHGYRAGTTTGSGWQYAYLTKDFTRNEVDVDFEYDFRNMGQLGIIGYDASGQTTFLARVSDAWAWAYAQASYLMYFYNSGTFIGGYYSDSYYVNPSEAIPSSGSGHWNIQFDVNEISITISGITARSITQSGVNPTTEIVLFYSTHTTYYSSGTFGNFDNYKEKGFPHSNVAPNTPPTPSGPTFGYWWTSLSYSFTGTDSDGDMITFEISWGETYGQYESGYTLTVSHVYTSPGSKAIKVRTIDEHGVYSAWSNILYVYIVTDNF